jgi:hypothetical protein
VLVCFISKLDRSFVKAVENSDLHPEDQLDMLNEEARQALADIWHLPDEASQELVRAIQEVYRKYLPASEGRKDRNDALG